MTNEDLKYQIALSLVPGVGSVVARSLIAYTGGVEAIFREKRRTLTKIPGVGEIIARRIVDATHLVRAEKEVAYIEKNGIEPLFFLDESYPYRLKECHDAPVILFRKGKKGLDGQKIISMVGTRSATKYGKELCDRFISDLSGRNYEAMVVSGLAYGIDVRVHKACLKYGVPTIAVLGHGLDDMYPELHVATSRKIVEHGALVSEFVSSTAIERQNFLQRNRIIAGLADATIIVESAKKGGALVTADIANSYNRDVFAFPGRCNDLFSEGCNTLIKRNQAALIDGLSDLEYFLSWNEEESTDKKEIQTQLFVKLSEEEQHIVDVLKEGEMQIDQISVQMELPLSKVSSLLLALEFKGIVNSKPGKSYALR